VPWFLDRPQSIGVQVFSRSYDYDFFSNDEEYFETSEGGTVTYGRSFRLFNSFSLAYTFARQEQEGIFRDPSTGEQISVSQSVIDSSSLRPVFSYNSIDNRFEPTRGTRLTLSGEYAGGFLGGENHYIKPELTFTMYRPLGRDYPVRTVAGLNVEAGYLEPFGEGIESVFRFFRLGGERSLRGFSTWSIVPINEDGTPFRSSQGFIIGGDRFLQANAEYHFLAGGPFRLVAFSDAGSVWGEGQDVQFDRLYWTAGLELRVLVPVFGAPLRFIYAFNLGDEPPLTEGDFEDFQFSIGATF
jgi:outer membrane protein insertion porin family